MKVEALNTLNYYQIANADPEAVKAGFLIRHYEYGVILDDLLRHGRDSSVQHYLVLGRRGSGKSTLLRRLQIEIDTNGALSDYIAINLAEEQANVYRLFDLLEEIARELEFRHIEIAWPDVQEEAAAYSEALLKVIHKGLKKVDKKLVLLLDNIDRIFENLGDDSSILRAYLQNHQDIKIIGASTRMTEHFWAYDKPFYEFFRILQLNPLSSDEVKTLLLDWGEKLKTPKLKEFVDQRPGQLETIRVLTDGLPRTLQFFVNILLTNQQETGYDYMQLIMDKVTPLYQERLNNLSPAHRKIVLQLAFFWEAVGAKELSKASRMENRLISAQLSQLIDKGISEKIATKTKNHLYRLSERFFNLWLIFTQGGPREKRKARYLTIFLENFYDSYELNEMAEEHLTNLEKKLVASDKAALLTKAYAQSSLIPVWLRDKLIEATREISGISLPLKNELPLTTDEIFKEVFKLTDYSDWRNAEGLISSIEQEDGTKEYMLGYLYMKKTELAKAEKNLLKSFRKGRRLAVGMLVELYYMFNKMDLAEKFTKIGLEEDNLNIAGPLIAFTYYTFNTNKEKALWILESVGDYDLLPVVKAWNGVFNGIEADVRKLAQSNSDLQFLFGELLVHHQELLVIELFKDEEFGARLSDNFYLIRLAAGLMAEPGTEGLKKIPTELREPIHAYMLSVYRKRDFYYKRHEAKQYLTGLGALIMG